MTLKRSGLYGPGPLYLPENAKNIRIFYKKYRIYAFAFVEIHKEWKNSFIIS